MNTAILQNNGYVADMVQRRFFEDQYAEVTLHESIPCVKIKLDGVPKTSEHYQLVYRKLVESVEVTTKQYYRMHLLTDSTNAGFVLDEDIHFYQHYVLPAIERAGLRYHAIVLPKSYLGRLFVNQHAMKTNKLQIKYFDSVRSACSWLRNS
jgi:hypothetical protein